jgi:hypothetical protein
MTKALAGQSPLVASMIATSRVDSVEMGCCGKLNASSVTFCG